jgi:hypothetical protein
MSPAHEARFLLTKSDDKLYIAVTLVLLITNQKFVLPWKSYPQSQKHRQVEGRAWLTTTTTP